MVCSCAYDKVSEFFALPIYLGVIGRGYYGQGSGAIHFRGVTCSGSEERITSCRYISNTFLTSHAQDVGVECQQGQILIDLDAYVVHFDSNYRLLFHKIFG